ncbi:1412_t:CDS:2 [Dentiscutata heterogama]|uniref:1412_t:CDS:1 n=1 Tax=Dentiscutata heterogama TaxID=1316150 RepID=A0ACA9KLA6_9GLOM|nr:1412_t:CDS:2 [Dentiscutata heterogama]
MNLKHSDDANYFNFGQRRDLLNGNIGYSIMTTRSGKIKTNYNDKFFNCNNDRQTNTQNIKIKSSNNNNGLQQLINIINFIQNIQNKLPEPKPDDKPETDKLDEPINEPETENPDKPMNKPETNKPDKPETEPETDKPDEPIDKPEPEPDYDLIFNTIEKEIKSTTRTDADQKKKLYRLYENKIQELKETKKFNKLLKNIKDKFFIGNLLDDKLHDLLIKVSELTEEQKNILQQARKDQLITVTNKIFDDLKNSIKTECYMYQLEDSSHYDQSIQEIHKEYLTNERKLKDLH